MRLFIFLIILFTPIVIINNVSASEAITNQQLKSRIIELETRMHHSESKIYKIEKLANDFGPILFLFAAFCALWAQNTGRNSWLWFFMGLLFHVFTILVLLYKNEAKT